MIKKLYKKFVVAIVAVVLTLTSFGCNQLPPDNSVPVIGLTLNKTELTLNVGETETLIATVNPTNATNKNVTWKSFNTARVTVDDNGVVKGESAGRTTIMVQTEDGKHFATCAVTVKDPDVPVDPNPDVPVDPDPDTPVDPDPDTPVDPDPDTPVDPDPDTPVDPDPDTPVDPDPDTPVDPDPDTPVDPNPDTPDDGGEVEVLEVGNAYQNSANLLATVDNTGREITAGAKKEEDYYVGVFYHLWHGDFGDYDWAQSRGGMPNLLNAQQLIDAGKSEELFAPDLHINEFYYWNEPLYGYYVSMDDWVLTRHIELFTTAGLDYICVDATNPAGPTTPRLFTSVVTKLLTILRNFQNQGFKTPKIMFYTNSLANLTVTGIYDNFYKSGENEDLWFKPNGKPLIVGVSEKNGNGTNENTSDPNILTTDETILNYFEFKDSKWPQIQTNLEAQRNAMPWMSWDQPDIFSQSLGTERDGYVALPIAQHAPYGPKGLSCASSGAPLTHRGYSNVTKQIDGDWKDGLSFQTMWDFVHENSSRIKTVMATGWNEWVAQKQPADPEYANAPNEFNPSGTRFIDVYNNEASRDLEMMRDPNGYGDNYYLQLMYNLRKLKMTDVVKYNFPTATVALKGDTIANLWSGVNATEYADFRGDAIARDSWDATGKTIHYVDNSNRNDIVNIKVTNDENFYYFCIETANDITPYSGGTNWMNLYIGTEYGDNTFAGFNYVLNRNPNVANGSTSLHRYNNGTWESAGGAQIRVEGNLMMIKLQRIAIDRTGEETKIRFKVTDNVQNWYINENIEHIMDCYVSGDSAPIGRLGYVYGN